MIRTLANGGVLESDIKNISLMASDGTIKWDRSPEALTIQLPVRLPNQPVIAFRITK